MSSNYKKYLKTQKKFKDPELRRLDDIIQKAIANYGGDLGELESAIGMLFLGHQYGWKVLHIIHSKATITKYEKILDIKVRVEFESDPEYAERSNGYRLIKTASNFWKSIRKGPDELPNKRNVDAP